MKLPNLLIKRKEYIKTKKTSNYLFNLINSSKNFISFEKWMLENLYTYKIGYYNSMIRNSFYELLFENYNHYYQNSKKIKNQFYNDFLTSPELTNLFSKILSNEIFKVLHTINDIILIEFGAGTGSMANNIINSINFFGIKIKYIIFEVSTELKLIQQKNLINHGSKIKWFKKINNFFKSFTLMNEILDSIPISIFSFDKLGNLIEKYILINKKKYFFLSNLSASTKTQLNLKKKFKNIQPKYTSEINLRHKLFINKLIIFLTIFVIMIIDYGFTQDEYYHKQRSFGTLIVHINNLSHDSILLLPGIQDITSHVDFTYISQISKEKNKVKILGFTEQGRYLINSGLIKYMKLKKKSYSLKKYLVNNIYINSINQLISEEEMGNIFKILFLSKNVKPVLSGLNIRNLVKDILKKLY